MDLHHLVKMANQIGAFFEAYPDRDYARNEISAHLQRFWEPRMREAIRTRLGEASEMGLSPLVADAVRTLK